MTSQVTPANSLPQERKGHSIQTPIDGLIVRVARRFGGSKAKEAERFIKFAIVGVLGFIVDFGTVNVLQSTIFPPVDVTSVELPVSSSIPQALAFVANTNGAELPINVAIATTIAFVAAVVNNFIWNRLWTYPDSRSRSIRRQLVQFTLVSISGWLVRTLWITFAYHPIGNLLYPALGDLSFFASMSPESAAARIGTNVALLIGVFVVMIWNFFANRYWTYSDVE